MINIAITCTICGHGLEAESFNQFGNSFELKIPPCGCQEKDSASCEFIEDCEHISAREGKFEELVTKYQDLVDKIRTTIDPHFEESIKLGVK